MVQGCFDYVHAPIEDKENMLQDEFYTELKNLFDYLQKYHTKIMLNDCNLFYVATKRRLLNTSSDYMNTFLFSQDARSANSLQLFTENYNVPDKF